MNKETILQALNWRYATKKFDPNLKIKKEDFEFLLETLRLSPSSYGLQPWKFLNIENKELRKKLREVSWNQSIVEEASHYVVLTVKKTMTLKHIEQHIDCLAQTRGLTTDQLQPFQKAMEKSILSEMNPQSHLFWNQRQAYIALGFILESAALIQIDATPIEGLDANQYNELLDLTHTEWTTVCAVALGYRHKEDSYQHLKKSRFSPSNVIETYS